MCIFFVSPHCVVDIAEIFSFSPFSLKYYVKSTHLLLNLKHDHDFYGTIIISPTNQCVIACSTFQHTVAMPTLWQCQDLARQVVFTKYFLTEKICMSPFIQTHFANRNSYFHQKKIREISIKCNLDDYYEMP